MKNNIKIKLGYKSLPKGGVVLAGIFGLLPVAQAYLSLSAQKHAFIWFFQSGCLLL